MLELKHEIRLSSTTTKLFFFRSEATALSVCRSLEPRPQLTIEEEEEETHNAKMQAHTLTHTLVHKERERERRGLRFRLAEARFSRKSNHFNERKVSHFCEQQIPINAGARREKLGKSGESSLALCFSIQLCGMTLALFLTSNLNTVEDYKWLRERGVIK